MNEYSIKEISEMVGVSTATISRHLNKNGYVNDKTRAKIESVLKKTGYNPEMRKRKQFQPLKGKSKYEISMIWNSSDDRIQSNTGQLMLLGASEVFQQNNVEFTVDCISHSGNVPSSLKKELIRRGALPWRVSFR